MATPTFVRGIKSEVNAYDFLSNVVVVGGGGGVCMRACKRARACVCVCARACMNEGASEWWIGG